MHLRVMHILFLLIVSSNLLIAQQVSGKHYKINKYRTVYLPLGKISFADKLVEYNVGHPAPTKKNRDSTQCLHEPNYVDYSTPNYVSLGCGGILILEFTNNGFMNLKGDDLYIFEVAPSRESMKIEISTNGKDWIYANKISGGTSSIDLSDFNIDNETVFYFVRITDLKDTCNGKSSGADIDAVGAINSVIKLSIDTNVLFDVAKAELIEDAKYILDSVATIIHQIDKATLIVEGHTDSDGTAEYNQHLSELRCSVVVDQMKILLADIGSYDYDITAFGENKPIAPNDTNDNKQLNRRVEITVIPPKDYFESLNRKN
jgi:outer membrane protein OmpA-like peptidoglycan-associated protein